MQKLQPIYTESINCQDCYKCVRQCPVKAIRICDNKASVIDEYCIHCGHCVQSCPTGAKSVRDGVARVKWLMEQNRRVFLSLAPSFMGEFEEAASPDFLKRLKALGFAGVSETALGAQEVSLQVNRFLAARRNGVFISSACPSVVELIRKYYPQHTTAITPFMSPMLTHARLLKQWYGNDIAVVFAGPCIAKKAEADGATQLVDTALTFKELRSWLDQSDNNVGKDLPDGGFVPYPAASGTIYPVEGGMIESLKGLHNDRMPQMMSFSGLPLVRQILDNLDSFQSDEPVFLELLACEGGCINGPGNEAGVNIVLRRLRTDRLHRNRKDQLCPVQNVAIERDYFGIKSIEASAVSEDAIQEALLSIGKKTIRDELNCSGCGYDTCRDFATALIENRAESSMCVSYMRNVAHNKATILLQKIPSGVVIVDENLKIVEMNGSFARMMGEETELCFDANPGLHGMEAEKILPFASVFKTALHTGHEVKEMAITENGHQYQLSVFNIQKYKLVAGIMQNLNQPQFRTDIIGKRTREVIQKNMETVQQIAFLLGENAAYTDSLLNSILEPEQAGDE